MSTRVFNDIYLATYAGDSIILMLLSYLCFWYGGPWWYSFVQTWIWCGAKRNSIKLV